MEVEKFKNGFSEVCDFCGREKSQGEIVVHNIEGRWRNDSDTVICEDCILLAADKIKELKNA